jgi:hypothetical protein
MTHGSSTRRTIAVEGLARVEGEGSLRVEVRDGAVADVVLDIFEPPRYFEALLVGRAFTEAPDITARICGICPVAYQMSACAAMEDACGVTVDGGVADLRRLLYCGSTCICCTPPTFWVAPTRWKWLNGTPRLSSVVYGSSAPAISSCKRWAAAPSIPSTSR